MSTEQAPPLKTDEWQYAYNLLLEVQRILCHSIESGHVEEHDHHIVGLPSGIPGAPPGGARVEAALHALMGARLLVKQVITGDELPGVPTLTRAQVDFGTASGYVAAIWKTELLEQYDGRSK